MVYIPTMKTKEMTDKIKIGTRVESEVNGELFSGIVKDIYVETTRGAPAPLFTIAIDRKNGEDAPVNEIESPAHMWAVPGSREQCEDCGETHNGMFGPAIMDLFMMYQKSGHEERHQIMLDMALLFMEELEATNLTVPEVLHDLANKFEEQMNQALNLQARLGRTIVAYLADATQIKSFKDVLSPNVLSMLTQAPAPKKPKKPLN